MPNKKMMSAFILSVVLIKWVEGNKAVQRRIT
jgi:hypothetical protein